MLNLNEVKLAGHLGDSVKYTQKDDFQVANMSLATNEKWADKDTGEKKTKTTWHYLVVFGNKAKAANEYLNKGSQIYVEGKLQTRKYIDKQQQEKYVTEVVVANFQFLDKKDNNPAKAVQNPPTASKDVPQPNSEDDDIPF